jgi:hypothetical protein
MLQVCGGRGGAPCRLHSHFSYGYGPYRISAMEQMGGLMKGGFLAHRGLSRSEDCDRNPVGEEPATQVVKNIRHATRRHFSAEDKIRIVLDGLHGEDSIAGPLPALYGDEACEEVVTPTATLRWRRTESSPEALRIRFGVSWRASCHCNGNVLRRFHGRTSNGRRTDRRHGLVQGKYC